jgi:hypothetical protein
MKVAVCFYTPQSYEQLRKVASDKNKLDDTYEDWLDGFHNAMTNLKSSGLDPVPFKINIDELEEWCKLHKYKNNSKYRAEYASEMAMKMTD